MVVPEQRKKAVTYFAGVFILYIAILVFLVFFTPGIEISEQQTPEGIEIFVANSSMHLIRELKVYTADGKELLTVEELKPREKVKVPLTGLSDLVVINASAPFHATISLSLSLRGTKGLKLVFETSYPSIALAGTKFTVFLDICNKGDIGVPEITIEEAHARDFFSEQKKTEKISLDRGQCRKIGFPLTPLKKGETEIYFNIKALGVSEEFKRTIKIEEP